MALSIQGRLLKFTTSSTLKRIVSIHRSLQARNGWRNSYHLTTRLRGQPSETGVGSGIRPTKGYRCLGLDCPHGAFPKNQRQLGSITRCILIFKRPLDWESWILTNALYDNNWATRYILICRSNRSFDAQACRTASTEYWDNWPNIPQGHEALEDTPLHSSIELSRIYSPFFNDCIGAVDGPHIPVSPPASERASFRDRSGNLSQNVLAVCNFDMRFTDVLSGWEGSIADSALWMEAISLGAVSIPEGKYVLGDAGFPNCDLCLTPYRGVRYHMFKRMGKVQ